MSMVHPKPEEPGPGQESVWDYPRPPRLETTDRHVVVEHAGVRLADSRRALRILETSHPPVYYLPPEDVRMDLLEPARDGRGSHCEWKGRASYRDVVVGDRKVPRAAWIYPYPTPSMRALKDHVAFYVGRLDACFVDGARVLPQPGGFYGGWITPDVVGPFKGEPGTEGW